MAEWQLLARDADGNRSGVVPIKSLSCVTRHMGADTGVTTVPYSRGLHELLAEGAGGELRRNGQTITEGALTSIGEAWGDDDYLKVAWVGDEQELFGDHLVMPDPTVPVESQPAGNWTFTGVASQVLTALLTQQVGPGAHVTYRVPGLTVDTDPVYGPQITASIRYGKPDLLAELQTLAIPTGLGLRVTRTADGGRLVSVVAPRNRIGAAQFSADLGNLAAYQFTRTPPTVTDVIYSGPSGPAVLSSTDPVTLAWGRRIWGYVDGDATAAAEELNKGAATVELTCKLRDTNRLAFGVDWQLGDRVTVHVGRPGEPKTPVVDIIREVAFEYGTDGERITPAIGSSDATALPTLPSRLALNKIAARLAGLERKN